MKGLKGLVLAGGSGTRLRPITYTNAKQLVPVANRPILFYAIQHLVDVGITDIGVITGETGPEVRAVLGDGSAFGARFTFIPQAKPLGLAHCVLIARPFLGDDDFVMYLGDNMLQKGVRPLVDVPGEPATRILLDAVDDPTQYGVAVLDGDRVTQLIEKPTEPPTNLALVGAYYFTPAVHEAVRAITPSWRDELEITDAIQWLIDNGHPVHPQQLEGWWLDTGKKDDLLDANRRVLDDVIQPRNAGRVVGGRIEGRVTIEAGVTVTRSVIRGPAIIGAGARIIDSYIGPYTAIAPGVTIARSHVENSVILDRARLLGGVRITDSIIGRDCTVSRRAEHHPVGASRLLIGDDCTLEIT